MLIIRLQRTGSRNSPQFRLVLAEKHRAAAKKAMEIFGQYDPKTKVLALQGKESLLSWIQKNVEISPTVRNLLITQKIIEGKKVQAWRPKKKAQPEATQAPAEKAEGKEENKTEEKTEAEKPAGKSAEATAEEAPKEKPTEQKTEPAKPEEKKEEAAP